MPGAGMLARFQAIGGGITDPNALHGKFYLPVLLDDTSITTSGAQTDYTSVAAGDFSQRGSGPKLAAFTLNTLTLDEAPDWYVQPGIALTHERMKEALQKINDARTPFDLLLTIPARQAVFHHCRATIRNLEQTMKGGQADTWYWAIQVEEWRNARAGRASHSKTSRKKSGRGLVVVRSFAQKGSR